MRRMDFRRSALPVVFLLVFSLLPVWAQPQREAVTMKFTLGSKVYELQGVPKPMDAAPVLLEGRMMLPIRYVAEPLYVQLHWDEKTKRIWLLSARGTIELRVGWNKAKINGEEVYIAADNPQVTPVVIDGRTMLPMRFIVENLGGTVHWDPQVQQSTVRGFLMPPAPVQVQAFMIGRENEAEEQERERRESQMTEEDRRRRAEEEERRRAEQQATAAENERKAMAQEEEDREAVEFAQNYRRNPDLPYLMFIHLEKGNRMKAAMERAAGLADIKGRISADRLSFMEVRTPIRGQAMEKILPADLNRGVERAPRIAALLLWNDPKKAAGAMGMPITDIAVLRIHPEDPRIGNEFELHHYGKSRWYCHPQNLNEGAEGEGLYLIYTKDEGQHRHPVTDLILTRDSMPPDGWERVLYAGEERLANLNEGTKGEPLYFFMKRAN